MGRQPGLDGIRTFSVGMVALHHAEVVHLWAQEKGFGVAHHTEVITGGFVFPEMFFVMSGFLITTIMLQEREGTGRFSLKGFYARRARRLLPGLWVMMAAVLLWATFFGTIHLDGGRSGRYHLANVGGSALATLLMSQNWWMIFGGAGYFGDFPDLFRHIWTLSIDEQFYILFPLLLVLLYGRGKRYDPRQLLRVCVPLIVIGWIVMAAFYAPKTGTDDFRLNFVYLSTITRMPGILLGVVLACVWQPWKWRNSNRGHLPWLDLIGLGSFALIMLIGVTAHNEAWYVYRGLFPIVSILAAAVAATVVHPGAVYTRAFFGNKVIAGIGQRAFGIYLWHWPIFAGPLATKEFGTKLLIGIPATALMAELSYRFIETPFRERAIGKWRDKVKAASGAERQALVRPVAIMSTGVLFLVGSLAIRVAAAPNDDITSDGGIDDTAEGFDATDDPNAPVVVRTTTAGTDTETDVATETDAVTETDAATGTETDPATDDTAQPQVVETDPPTTEESVPPQTGRIRMAIVGSSQAVMLQKNLPTSAKETFRTSRGGRSGCTVFSDGRIEGHKLDDDGNVIEGKLFKWSFKDNCKTWLKSWTKAADEVDAELVLVVTGGWEIFDLILDDETLEFGSEAFDAYYMENMQIGIDAMIAKGAKVALLEPACQRPVDDPGAGVPPLAERSDDSRPKHIASLMKKLAKRDPKNVYFIENAPEWCNDPSIAENKAYRFDGVHVLGKGAKLIMDTITPALLDIPLPGR